jgi:hypothetical protein
MANKFSDLAAKNEAAIVEVMAVNEVCERIRGEVETLRSNNERLAASKPEADKMSATATARIAQLNANRSALNNVVSRTFAANDDAGAAGDVSRDWQLGQGEEQGCEPGANIDRVVLGSTSSVFAST